MTTYQRSANFTVHSSAAARPNSRAWLPITRLATLTVAALIVLTIMLVAIDLTMGYTIATPAGSPVVGPGAGLGL